MKTRVLLGCILLAATACANPSSRAPHAEKKAQLTLATWNMEHLAERDGSGCRPRVDADYQAMRRYVAALGADVIAFQEVESKAAAERVFDPAAYTVLIEAREESRERGSCREPGLTINAQRTGFAIRKGLRFERRPDLTALQLGDADLRSAVDVIVRAPGVAPARLLSVHLKSGCSSDNGNEACAVLDAQVPVLERWIDARATEGIRFGVLGDFNRRLAAPGDRIWAELDDASPPGADLSQAAGARPAQCDPRYPDFIDLIVLDRRATSDLAGFEERTFDGPALSDHCAIVARLRPGR